MNPPTIPTTHFAERRKKPRVVCVLPAILRRTAADGSRQCEPARVLNMSTSDVYLKLEHTVQLGEHVLVVLWFNPQPSQAPSHALAARGTVIRVDAQPNDTFGAAVHFERYRFI